MQYSCRVPGHYYDIRPNRPCPWAQKHEKTIGRPFRCDIEQCTTYARETELGPCPMCNPGRTSQQTIPSRRPVQSTVAHPGAQIAPTKAIASGQQIQQVAPENKTADQVQGLDHPPYAARTIKVEPLERDPSESTPILNDPIAQSDRSRNDSTQYQAESRVVKSIGILWGLNRAIENREDFVARVVREYGLPEDQAEAEYYQCVDKLESGTR